MSEWISAEDRLPKENEEVIIICISHGEPSEFGHMNTFKKGEKYRAIDSIVKWKDREYCSFRADRFWGIVTHWMPLPDFPM